MPSCKVAANSTILAYHADLEGSVPQTWRDLPGQCPEHPQPAPAASWSSKSLASHSRQTADVVIRDEQQAELHGLGEQAGRQPPSAPVPQTYRQGKPCRQRASQGSTGDMTRFQTITAPHLGLLGLAALCGDACDVCRARSHQAAGGWQTRCEAGLEQQGQHGQWLAVQCAGCCAMQCEETLRGSKTKH